MMRPLYFSIAIAAAALQLSACDDGVQEEAAASRTRDSSLAQDLRLARGDTSHPAGADTALPGSVPPMVASKGGSSSESAPARVVSNGRPTTAVSAGSIDPAANVSADGYAGPSCASPALPDQRRCLLAYLARSDVALDRNYQALITQLKREAGTKTAGREPPTVVRLRTAQRNWLVYRDEECQRRNAGTEGPLWAPTRAKCLSEYSGQRTRELANALNDRARIKLAPEKSVTTKPTKKRAKVARVVKRTRNRQR